MPHASSTPSCPLPCSPAHREIGVGILSRARAGVLDTFPILGILGLTFRDTFLIPANPQRTIWSMNRGMSVVVQFFLPSRKMTRTTDMASFSTVSDCTEVDSTRPRRATLPRGPGDGIHPLRALRGGGDGVRRGRGEVAELVRERRDELIDDHLQRHQRGGPPLLVHDGDMSVRAAQHLV
jgi:hypothetical protein